MCLVAANVGLFLLNKIRKLNQMRYILDSP